MSGGGGDGGLRARFARHLSSSGLLHGGQRVLVACSGGLDSVCLLHLLRFGAPRAALQAAHFDHCMRTASGADAEWVRGLCTAWGVPLVAGRAARPPRGETAARQLRYAFLYDAARAAGADVIATAHHVDDQAETVLFRLARGTGLTGLAAIPERRGMIVRPLLPFTRAELLAYAAAARLRWREDRSNLDLRFARNRIRHVVLPALEAVRPGAARRVARIAERAAEAESAWRDLTLEAERDIVIRRDDGSFELARDRLLSYHPHVRDRVLRHLARQLGSRMYGTGTRTAAEFINAGASGSRVELAGGLRLEREFDRLLLRRIAGGGPAADEPLAIRAPESGAGSFMAGGRRYTVRWTLRPEPGSGGHVACFDPQALRFPLALRSWRPGDRIRLVYGSKKLKKVFLEARIGRGDRDRVPILCDGEGRVLWVAGVARSSEAQPAQDGEVFTVTVKDGEPD
jgi:tRNA(Ile)-lysidine synthase